MQGLKKAYQQSILEDFNKYRRITKPSIPPPVVTPVPTAPIVSLIQNPTSVGYLAPREDVLTREATWTDVVQPQQGSRDSLL